MLDFKKSVNKKIGWLALGLFLFLFTVLCYHRYTLSFRIPRSEWNFLITLQHLKQETANLMKKIEQLEASKRFSIHPYILFVYTFSFHWQQKEYIACVLFIPQEALGRRLGFMLLWRTATDRTTVGKECKQCSCKKG